MGCHLRGFYPAEYQCSVRKVGRSTLLLSTYVIAVHEKAKRAVSHTSNSAPFFAERVCQVSSLAQGIAHFRLRNNPQSHGQVHGSILLRFAGAKIECKTTCSAQKYIA